MATKRTYKTTVDKVNLSKQLPSPMIWDETKLDDLHFSWDEPLSYNKTWNFAIGERESGKSVNS